MMNQIYENWSQATKNNLQPLNEWFAAMSKMSEMAAREQIRLSCDCVGICMKECQNMANAKKPEDVMKGGANMVFESMEKSMECMQNMMNVCATAMGQNRDWFENHMAHQCLTPECCGGTGKGASGSGKSSQGAHHHRAPKDA